MDPLAVEAQLGSVDSWPSYVLRLMFMLEPNSRVMKKVAASMYGNNARLTVAVACYRACNSRHHSRVETVLRAWTDVRNGDVNQRQMEQYYSMLSKCLAWINAKVLEQYEVVNPVVILSKYGPAATRYPGRKWCKIESIHPQQRRVVTAAAAAVVEAVRRRVY